MPETQNKENRNKTQTTPVIINLDEVVARSAPFNVAEPELSEEKIIIEDTPFLQLQCFHETRFFLVNIEEVRPHVKPQTTRTRLNTQMEDA